MKNPISILIAISLTFSIILSAEAQDIEFSQYYSTKNYLNPAFTSLSSDLSFSTTYRNQWPSIKNAYESYFVGFDKSIKNKNAGIGLYYLGDLAGEGALFKQSIAFLYSKHVRLSRNIYASFGLKASYNSVSIKWDQLVWGDMLDARKGITYNTQQQRGATNQSYFDTGSGFIIYSEKMQGGVALEHINRPKQSLLSIYSEEKIPLRFKFHAGGNIPLQISPNAPLVTISPQLIFTKQSNSSQTSLGAYVTYSLFTIGVWHRLKESMIILVGIKKDGFQFGYSYDLGVNKLIAYTGGAHELTLAYGINTHHEKKKKYRLIDCPMF